MLSLVEHEKSYKTPGPAQSSYVCVYAQSDLSLYRSHMANFLKSNISSWLYMLCIIFGPRGLSLVEAHIIRKVYLT